MSLWFFPNIGVKLSLSQFLDFGDFLLMPKNVDSSIISVFYAVDTLRICQESDLAEKIKDHEMREKMESRKICLEFYEICLFSQKIESHHFDAIKYFFFFNTG